jgi:solute carrier family 25 phosphate transporter 3
VFSNFEKNKIKIEERLKVKDTIEKRFSSFALFVHCSLKKIDIMTTVNPLSIKDATTGFRPAEYYARCMMGGVAACGVTHASVVTLDVAKVRAQAHSKSGKWPAGLIPSIQKTWQLEGLTGVTKGWAPTFYGYGLQGLFKFGLNEFFKDAYTKFVGEEKVEASLVTRMTLWAAAAGSAEIVADIALCPFEMTKVKMQVMLPGQAGGVSNSMIPAMREMQARSVETKFPFGSLYPLWGRQIPYTMIKFVGFYQTQEMVYAELEKRTGKRKSDFGDAQQLGITFACGYWAGIFCAIATQPMDNLVSMKVRKYIGLSLASQNKLILTMICFPKNLSINTRTVGRCREHKQKLGRNGNRYVLVA